MTAHAYADLYDYDLESDFDTTVRRVAEAPRGGFAAESGRELAKRLGYSSQLLDRVPAPAVQSFCGVGHHFRLARLEQGEAVLDLASGHGMDAFVAATYVGPFGRVLGVDMSEPDRQRASAMRRIAGFEQVSFPACYVEALPLGDESVDTVLGNGVAHWAVDVERALTEAARVVKPGGKLVLSDVVTAQRAPWGRTAGSAFRPVWIARAMHREDYQNAIEDAGFTIRVVQPNHQYRFRPGTAARAAIEFGARSISILATKN
jgi:SAM-dependent methyltransferase